MNAASLLREKLDDVAPTNRRALSDRSRRFNVIPKSPFLSDRRIKLGWRMPPLIDQRGD